MKWIIDVGAKLAGLGWVWDRINGSKTYLAAAVSVLSGLSGLIQSFLDASASQSFASLSNWVQHLGSNPSWILILVGVKAFTLRHALEKQGAPAAPEPATPAPAPETLKTEAGGSPSTAPPAA